MNSSLRQGISGFTLACVALLGGLAGCAGTESAGTSAPPPSTAASTPAAAPASPTAPAAVADGCPPDVNLMYEWLKATPEIMAKIDKSMNGIEEPKCYQGWSMARTRMGSADAVQVLFKMDPATGKWIPVAVGTDSVCDALQVPAEVQAKLGPAC